MKSYLFTCLIMLLFIGTSAQKKNKKQLSSQQSMEESIRRAREQEALYKAAQESNPNEKPFAKVGAALPAFQVVTLEQKALFDTELPADKPIILFLFNPGCGHCVDMGKVVRDSIQQLKGATLLFITASNQLGELPVYAKETGLGGMNQVIISADNTNVNKYLFEYNGMPQMMVYGKDRVLRKTFYKYASMDSLRFYLNKK